MNLTNVRPGLVATVVRTYPMVEVFYRHGGRKISKLFRTRTQADEFRHIELPMNHRKYLGTRNVTLAEVE